MMLRPDRIDELGGRPERDYMAVIDNCDSVAQPLGLVHVMSRQHNGAPRSTELLDQSPELPPRLRIETGGWLVEKKELGIANERAGDCEALLLTARECPHARILLLAKLDDLDHALRVPGTAVEAAEKIDCFTDRQLVGQLCVLKLNPKALAQVVFVVLPGSAEDLDFTRVSGEQPFADFYGRSLTGSIGAEQAEALAVSHLQIQAVDCDDVAVSLPKAAHDKGMAVGDGGCCGCHRSGTRIVMPFGQNRRAERVKQY